MNRIPRTHLLNFHTRFDFSTTKVVETEEEKALKWKRQFNDKKHIYHILIGPTYDLLRIVGRAPFYRDSTGKMEFKYWSAIMVYSLLTYVLVSWSAVISTMEICLSWDPGFGDNIEKLLIVSMIIPQVFLPVLCGLQLNSTQQYWNLWTSFQEKYEVVTGRKFLRVNEVKPRCFSTSLYTFLTALLVLFVQPYNVKDQLKWYYFPAYIFTVIGNMAYFWFWILTSRMVIKVSKEFCKHFYAEIDKNEIYTPKIEEYRLLWLHLSHIIRECGSSNSLFISMFMLSIIFNVVAQFYLTVFHIYEHLMHNEIMDLLGHFILTFFWWAILKAYCNAGYLMTESCTSQAPENVFRIKTHNSTADELRINILLYTLRQFRPEVTASGFYVVNRILFGLISMAVITYIIIVIQFHMSNHL